MSEWILRDRRNAEKVLHPSTEGALRALAELGQTSNFSRILDLGCGSGLLSLRAAELWPEASITAADISEAALADISTNLAQYGLAHRIAPLRSDGFGHPVIRAQGPYDLIICNLLADIAIRLSPELKAHLAPQGTAILSGILAWMQPAVEAAHAALGFEITGEWAWKEWRTLLMQKT